MKVINKGICKSSNSQSKGDSTGRTAVLQQMVQMSTFFDSWWYLTCAALLRSSICIGIQVHSAVVLRTTAQSRLCGASCTTSGAFQARLGDGVGNGGKHLVDIVPALRAGLEEQQVFLVRIVLALFRADPAHLTVLLALTFALSFLCFALLLILHKVELVAHQRDNDTRAGLSLQLSNPVLSLDQTAGLGDVVDDERALRVAVVHGRQAGEALLARGIPDLELDRAVGEVAFLRQEGGADRGLFVRLEGVVDEAEDEGRLWQRRSVDDAGFALLEEIGDVLYRRQPRRAGLA